MKLKDRILHAWNAFNDNGQQISFGYEYASSRPTHKASTSFNMTSYVSSIYNRIAIDVSLTEFKHVKIDPENEDITDMKSSLNDCLTVEANIDQTHIQFIHDLTYSMFDEGVVAVVPVETTISPRVSGGYDINSLRVGRIVNWFPKHVEVDLYNDNTGKNERVIMEKKNVAIIENPLYAVVNHENSTLKRLMRKLNQLDNIDDVLGTGRLDLLLSVPYSVKTDNQRKMAEQRIRDIEAQLTTSRNGIAYIDGTEKATQLNRPINNQLPEQIEKLTQQFYNQLGLTETIFNGTASEAELRNYYSRSINPIVKAIVAEFRRKFLTKTARTQGQTITFYRDMFEMVPAETIASLGDTLRRNSIATSNEIRKFINLKPSNDPRADELFNPNIADKNQNPADNNDGVVRPKTADKEELERMERKLEKVEPKKPGSLTPPDKKSK